jgi:sodium/potassium-transporting ATPase subunit alpha
VMIIKGAPDVLFPSCSTILRPDGTVASFEAAAQSSIRSLQATWSRGGERVLAVCKKSIDNAKFYTSAMSPNKLENTLYNEIGDLTLVGLISIRDPPREAVAQSIEAIRRAGVRVFMVTGDFMVTAVAIAKQVSLVFASRRPLLIRLASRLGS